MTAVTQKTRSHHDHQNCYHHPRHPDITELSSAPGTGQICWRTLGRRRQGQVITQQRRLLKIRRSRRRLWRIQRQDQYAKKRLRQSNAFWLNFQLNQVINSNCCMLSISIIKTMVLQSKGSRFLTFWDSGQGTKSVLA